MYLHKRKNIAKKNQILADVMEHTGLSWQQIISDNRSREICIARSIILYLLHKEANYAHNQAIKLLNRKHGEQSILSNRRLLKQVNNPRSERGQIILQFLQKYGYSTDLIGEKKTNSLTTVLS